MRLHWNALVVAVLSSIVVGGCNGSAGQVESATAKASITQSLAGLPDLTIDRQRLAANIDTRVQNFTSRSCAVVEGCVGGTGKRTLLRFDVGTPNIGAADMVLGVPDAAGGDFHYSECHGHYHLEDYARYELLSADGGTVVLTGHKQAFCLLDMYRYLPDAGPSKGYSCADQGITAGWADLYYKGLDCQWLDVTNVPSGDYQLRVSINTLQALPESDYSNNTVSVPVRVGGKQGGRGNPRPP